MIITTQAFSITEIAQQDCELLVIPVPAGKSDFPYNDYPTPLRDAINHYIKLGDWNSKSKYLLCINPINIKAKRILLVNANINLSRTDAARICQWIMATLEQLNQQNATLVVPSCMSEAEHLLHALYYASYSFSDYKTTKSTHKVKHIDVLATSAQFVDVLTYASALHQGQSLARDLANMPGNICTPGYFARQSELLAERYTSIATTVLDEAALTELAMEAYLAVGRGSAEPSCMPVIRYTGATPETPAIWIIGKGITFDTGGITLKKPEGMQNMIYDMCGGAAVLGLMAAIAELELPVNVTGVIATAENMPDGDAFRPGDILTSMSEQTVEIISTDAEGRLVLCDAITYARQHHPALIIDVATLTGAQIVSLGSHASGLMGNSPALNRALEQAGEQSGDRAWTMPIWPDYQDALNSPCADMRNAGSNSPGMITAGCYLARFADTTPWAHLDIAGTSFQYGKGNSATGRPLPLLLQFLRNYSNLSAPKWSIDTDACGFLP